MEKTILLIHGPNLNKLGSRVPEHYGAMTLKDLEDTVAAKAKNYGYNLLTFQSNHEGSLIDCLQEHAPHCCAVIINPGALTHYSYALHDAIHDSRLPTVEVHLSNIDERETWRSKSVVSTACIHTIKGKKLEGYLEAVEFLAKALSAENSV